MSELTTMKLVFCVLVAVITGMSVFTVSLLLARERRGEDSQDASEDQSVDEGNAD
ncbi:hypothetical protein ACFL1X_14730 [Candidatus Hydrogenedentota bacterium]